MKIIKVIIIIIAIILFVKVVSMGTQKDYRYYQPEEHSPRPLDY